MRHLISGDAKGFLTMFIRKKRHRSGNIGVIVVEKIGGKMKELATIGVAYSKDEVENLVNEAKEIYRYLDKLSDHQHEIVQDISVRHTAKLLGGNIGVLFYDVTTLYFEADYEDELRKTGFSKEGRHSNPQIILGLLVSLGGYPLAYCIHEGNKYEGHTMLPTINEFVSKYGLENFVVVADSGLMNHANIAELEAHGYKYIIDAKIKNESQEVKNWILEQPKRDCQMVE